VRAVQQHNLGVQVSSPDEIEALTNLLWWDAWIDGRCRRLNPEALSVKRAEGIGQPWEKRLLLIGCRFG